MTDKPTCPFPGRPLMENLIDGGAVAVVASYGPGNGSDYHSLRTPADDVAWLRALADEIEAKTADQRAVSPPGHSADAT